MTLIAYIDFEFNGMREKTLNLVSCSIIRHQNRVEIGREEFWLFESPRLADELINRIRDLAGVGYIFAAYVLEAEARSIMSIWNWLPEFKAIDLFLEYRCLLNRNNELAYGKQYIDGKIIKTTPPPPKWEREEFNTVDNDLHHKPSFSLASAIYKLLGKIIDTEEKDIVRRMIYMPGWEEKIPANRERIQKYNMSDVELLPDLLRAMKTKFNEYGISSKEWLEAAYIRAEYSIATAKMVSAGYPVNMEKIKKFVGNIKPILKHAADGCFQHEVKEPFKWNKKLERYVLNEKEVRDWIEKQGIEKWRKTSGGKKSQKKVSLSKDAFADWFTSESDGFAGAFCRYLKTKQSLNGFLPGTGRKGTFFDFVGTDGRVRPNFGIYGAQSSRSQPGAVGFIPLKAHWMRNFIEPSQGKAIAQADFSSEEFLVAAILSQDKAMMDAYASGDVYLAFGKAAGLIPQDGTKTTHKVMRDVCKALVLGISYDMSAGGLAPRISKIMKSDFSQEKAQDLIDQFYEVYSDYKEFKDETLINYSKYEYLKLSDGWIMFGDNDNRRSVGNCPIQGESSVIMRQCVKDAQSEGLNIIWTNHDSLAMEYDAFETFPIQNLVKVMQASFEKVMSQFGITIPVRIDCETWSKSFRDTTLDEIKISSEYIPTKGHDDFLRYKPFFT